MQQKAVEANPKLDAVNAGKQKCADGLERVWLTTSLRDAQVMNTDTLIRTLLWQGLNLAKAIIYPTFHLPINGTRTAAS
jgi:hypothetical protein